MYLHKCIVNLHVHKAQSMASSVELCEAPCRYIDDDFVVRLVQNPFYILEACFNYTLHVKRELDSSRRE